jgi:hypothetical protein
VGDFMLLLMEDEGAHAAEDPKAVARLIEKRAAFVEGARRSGVLADAARFRPSKEGKRVRRQGGRAEVVDGPFADDGRALAGYCCVRADGAEAAAAIAAGCPVLPADVVDVRPIMKGSIDADKESKPGKIFAFGVTGSADTEEAWVAIMDRIDAESHSVSPVPGRCGGVRLMPPKTGRRVATEGGRRAIFDGPFLESKEVVGGIFFARMASIEDAVRWASETPYIAFGTLEIRELWRS